MDFQAIADGIGAMTCVISVEKLKDGGYGAIRIVTGNRAYLDSITHPRPGMEMLTEEFIPNAEYTRYLTRDLNFENYCYHAAVEKKCMHAYARPERMGAWFNMIFLPLIPDDGDLCYCTYTMEISTDPDPGHMSEISGELSSSILKTSLKLRGAKDFEATMADVIRDIRALCDAEYCCILLTDPEKRRCRVLCEDFSKDSAMQKTGMLESAEFYPIAESWENTIAGSNCLLVKNEQDMAVVRERNPEWQASLQEIGVRTIVLFPLKNGDSLLGYIWATNFDPDQSIRIKETLELTTFILSSEIANYLLLEKLRRLSSLDLLTGANNRNMMNQRLDAFTGGRECADGPVGVLFADLNGLKYVNDTKGHEAGDELLKNAANALRQVFDSADIYRAGGDEFTIFVPGATDKLLAEKAAALRTAEKDWPGVAFALGYAAAETGRRIDTALTAADKNMYEDKRRYYELHPEKTRRAR